EGVGQVAEAECDGRRIEACIIERKVQSVPFDELDLRMLAARDREHLRAEVDAHHPATSGELRELRRQLARAACHVQGRSAGSQSRLARGLPAPARVGARGQHRVDGVVAAGDAVEHRPHCVRISFAQIFCQIEAMPCPTPMHIVARPYSASRCSISRTSVPTSRAPLLPRGCPSAIAPPLTLTLSSSKPRSRMHASDCDANASFSSTTAISPGCNPSFSSAFSEEGTGPMPMYSGCTPAGASATSRASGCHSRSRAFLAAI